MKRTLQASGAAALAALAFLLIQAALLVRDAGNIAKEAQAKVFAKGELYDRLNDAALHADQLAGEARIAAKEAATASQEQRAFLKKLDPQVSATVGKFHDLLTHTASAVDGVASDAHQAANDLHGVAGALKKDIEDADPALRETAKAISDLDANLINDPDIKKALADLAAALKNTEGVTADMHAMTTDLAAKLHHLTTDKPSLKTRIIGWLQVAYYAVLLKGAAGIKF